MANVKMNMETSENPRALPVPGPLRILGQESRRPLRTKKTLATAQKTAGACGA
jgi:hypothetical protein